MAVNLINFYAKAYSGRQAGRPAGTQTDRKARKTRQIITELLTCIYM